MSATWTGVVDAASLIVTALGIVVGGVVLARTERLLPALAALLEMLTAAGLLRLAAAPTLPRALTAGGILLVRRLATAGLGGGLPLGGLPLRLRALTGRARKAVPVRAVWSLLSPLAEAGQRRAGKGLGSR